jgi:hypothetical protein
MRPMILDPCSAGQDRAVVIAAVRNVDRVADRKSGLDRHWTIEMSGIARSWLRSASTCLSC